MLRAHAPTWSFPFLPATNLRRLCDDTLDGTNMDPRPARSGARPDTLLRDRATVEGASFLPSFRRTVSGLSEAGALLASLVPKANAACQAGRRMKNDLSIYEKHADTWWSGETRWLRTL